MKLSTSEENYIKAIFKLQDLHNTVPATLLAAEVKTKAASVTDMLKKLYSKKIIHYKPYKNFTLTNAGKKIALDIIRKHRLWEYFLVHKLGMNWDEVHPIAEEMEHVNNPLLIQKLDEYLEHPCFDPHGDPIPDKNGNIRMVEQSDICSSPIKKTLTVSSIKDQSITMMDLLKHYQIKIGTKLKLVRKFDFDGSVEIKIEKLAPTIISNQVAKNIFCTQ
ncbi:MAG: metal-dependent transcriptional regulator [Bacteroidetes bacterium]|nr:metal-dependent transcriptional regulator [Bacteroidota bacterium]MBS1757467.1 metal-dependent transcriptional regulator [Bacteroidota bacterium]